MQVISARPAAWDTTPGTLVTVATSHGNAGIWVNAPMPEATADVAARPYGVWPAAASWRAVEVHERTRLVAP